MPNYRRRYGEGGTFAFTVCLADRRQTTLTDNIGIMREAYRATCRDAPFRTLAICVLPNHLHAVWTLPEGDADYSRRWRSFKLRVTHAIGRRVWQPRYWEHTIRDGGDLANHVNYVHYNPVKHGHAENMDDWPHSSWHRWKRSNAWSPPPEDMPL
ncbi:REP-associated tyrosine transposase [Parvularcula dongshanensis]|uniref:Putative transposase n=1 Tax=Parvularcula dongshanensis TaxID=1173995 RepID=A0A840I1K9_9PROT|nr:transposase [Parvularcula dongshanensis]MBB4658637.1 putative transposase [Parvularcula dongshanensis]